MFGAPAVMNETILETSMFKSLNFFATTLRISLPDVPIGADSNLINSSLIVRPSEYLAKIANRAYDVTSVVSS